MMNNKSDIRFVDTWNNFVSYIQYLVYIQLLKGKRNSQLYPFQMPQ